MSLRVYLQEKDIPNGMEIIRINDAFFDTNSDIRDTPLIRNILLDVDKAEYINTKVFRGRDADLGNLFASNLSTGTKTLINIIEFPEKCFDITECGANAQQFIKYIKEGNILWKYIDVYPTGNKDCDINCNSKHFLNFNDFIEYCIEQCTEENNSEDIN